MMQQSSSFCRIGSLTTVCVWAVLLVGMLSLVSQTAESFVPKHQQQHNHQQTVASRKALALRSNSNSNSLDEDIPQHPHNELGRRTAVARMVLSPPLVAASVATAAASPALAEDAKQTNLPEADLVKIIVDQDLVQNQFLVNGRLTRSIYDESCTFQDEIDTYGLEQWMKGTAKLFDGDRSKVVLVPGSVQSSKTLVQFRFVEYLCFNIPVVKPIVYLSGTLFLTVSESTGLVTSYREKWDQDINKVLTSESKLFTSGLSKESLDQDLEAFFKANANLN